MVWYYLSMTEKESGSTVVDGSPEFVKSLAETEAKLRAAVAQADSKIEARLSALEEFATASGWQLPDKLDHKTAIE